MENLQQKIVKLYGKDDSYGDPLHHALSHLQNNKEAFCLMPEWMQKAMGLLPLHAVQFAWRKMETSPCLYEWKEVHAGSSLCDRLYADWTYRLSPDYVFEEDEPTVSEMLTKSDLDMSEFGKAVFDLACSFSWKPKP